jgi:ABC-2 type transport system permease protein
MLTGGMAALIDPDDPQRARYAALAAQPFQVTSAHSLNILEGWRSVREVVGRRQLLGLLIRRDLKARFKDSALGLVWSLLKPLTQFAIYFFVVGQILGAARGIPDFAIFVFAGLTIYGLFAETINGATQSIINNAGLIKKVALPREIFPLASVGSGLFNFAIQVAVLIVAALALGGLRPGLHLLYAFPAIAVVVIYALALGLVLAAVNVYLRDIQYLTELVLMVLLWASPIVYSWSMAAGIFGRGLLLEIYSNNPVTLSVMAFQYAFRSPEIPAEYPADLLLRLGVAAVIGLVVLVIAQRVFSRLEGNFAQEL